MVDEAGDQFVAYFLPTEDTLFKRATDADAGMDYTEEEIYDYKLGLTSYLMEFGFVLISSLSQAVCAVVVGVLIYSMSNFLSAREYNWNVKNKMSKGYEENYFFVFRNDAVTYNELETRVQLRKRRVQGYGHQVCRCCVSLQLL